MLSALGPALRKLPDLERGATRAFHGTSRPADLAALLQQFAGLPEQLGVGADLQAPASAVATAAAGDDAGGEGGGSGGSPSAALNLRGVQSALLQQLLRSAADPAVSAAARQMLAALDLAAAAANDTLNALK